MSEERICPKCQTSNDSSAEKCSGCGLDLELFDYVYACLTGKIPQISSKTILEPGESAFFTSNVSMLAQKTETLTKHNFIGSRVRLGGMPIYFGQSTPQKQSQEILADAGSGEFTLTNRRIIIVSDKETFSIPLSKIVDFEHAAGGIQIFVEGKHGGMIYQVDRPWQLWILLFSLLKAKGIQPTNDHEIEELRHFALHICEEVKGVQTDSNRQEWIQTVFHSDAATILWLIVCPPIGFYCLWENSRFGLFTKAILCVLGLYALGRWSMFFQGIG
jgi:hypothetical protein